MWEPGGSAHDVEGAGGLRNHDVEGAGGAPHPHYCNRGALLCTAESSSKISLGMDPKHVQSSWPLHRAQRLGENIG